MFNNKIKGICSVISSVFAQLIIGNCFTFGNFVYYYKSYLHYKNIDNISILNLLFVAPTSAACLNILPIFTGYLDKILGIRILTIMSALCALTSQLIIYFYTKYYLMIIAYIFYGFSGSITYLPTLRNCWKYYPKKKGIISGILFSSCGLSTFLFTSIGDYIINPKAEAKKDSLYSKEVAMRYTKYLKFYIICIIVLGILSSLLSFPYKEEENPLKEVEDTKEDKIIIDENKENDNEEKNEDENVNIINDEKDNRYSVKSNKEEENKNNNNINLEKDEELTIKECLFSIQFLQCFSIVGCTLLFGFLLTNTYRPFGLSMKLNELGIQSLSKVFTLLNTFSRIVWGLIYDKFGFKYPYMFVCINQITCSSLIYFSAKNIYTYFICCCFGVLSFSGHIILFPNLIAKKFGVSNSVTLMGVCGLLGGSTCLLGPVLTSSIIKENSDYLKTYLIAGSTTIVSLILIFIVKIEKMKKSDLLEKENGTEKIKEESEKNTSLETTENTKNNTIEENVKDNDKDNITKNNTENNVEKEEKISENIEDNKEEKLIDN